MTQNVLELFRLDGKIAAVTGATRGLGAAMAVALAEAGADVALLQRSEGDRETVDKISALGRRVVVVPCDMESREQVSRAVPAVLEQLGGLDILVNSAGIQRRGAAAEFTQEDWDLVLQVDLTSAFFLSQAAGRHMLEVGGGKIINIASMLSYQGGLMVPAYAAAKSGVAQFTRSLSNEWARHGVNVNAIAPGYFATEINIPLMSDPERNAQIMARLPAGRWGAPEELKGMVVFLASRASDYVHGVVYNVDGGYLGR